MIESSTCQHSFTNDGTCIYCHIDYGFFCASRFWESTCRSPPVEVPTEVSIPDDDAPEDTEGYGPPTMETVLKEIREMQHELSILPDVAADINTIRHEVAELPELSDPGTHDVVLHEIRHLKRQLDPVSTVNLISDFRNLQHEMDKEEECEKELIAKITEVEKKLIKVEELKVELKKATEEISVLKTEQIARNEKLKQYMKDIQQRYQPAPDQQSVPEDEKESQADSDTKLNLDNLYFFEKPSDWCKDLDKQYDRLNNLAKVIREYDTLCIGGPGIPKEYIKKTTRHGNERI